MGSPWMRMEPVFFSLGQVAGAAAALAIKDGGKAVQDVDYSALHARLVEDGLPITDSPNGLSEGRG